MPNMNRIDAVFQKLLSGHHFLLCFYIRPKTPSKISGIDAVFLKVIERTPNFDNGLTHGRTNARTNGQGKHIMPLHHSSNGGGIIKIK